jgi:DNA-binding NarL/FixJ family response regulator
VKPFDPEELLARVRRLLPAPVAEGRKVQELTQRELDVLSFLVEGLNQSEIAEKLVLSPRTVGKHIEHILRKLDVHSRAQAVSVALRDDMLLADSSSPPEVEASSLTRH